MRGNVVVEGPLWLVLDVRLARQGVNSGISRFIVGLAQALAQELHDRRTSAGEASVRVPKLLLASKYEPPQWAVNLVCRYPDSVSFWSGGKGALSNRFDKPVFYWPSRAFERIRRMTGGNLLWIAPGNFDRPFFSSRLAENRHTHQLVQIIHDTIPFEFSNCVGFTFGVQFRTRVRHALARLPHVLTVSEHSAQFLKSITKNRVWDIPVIGEGVDALFGKDQRPHNQAERLKLREDFLKAAGYEPSEGRAEFDTLLKKDWVVAVGRDQSYKRWDLAEASVTSCTTQRENGVLLVRVVGSPQELGAYSARNARPRGRTLFLEKPNTLIVSSLEDESLALLYRVGDLLIHPSHAEGFGLPPLEAALSGMPVLFKNGTAVEDHFRQGALPTSFWRGVDSDSEGEWTIALSEFLNGDAERTRFFKEMAQSPSPREYVLKYSEGRRFEWREAACVLLDALVPNETTAGASKGAL